MSRWTPEDWRLAARRLYQEAEDERQFNTATSRAVAQLYDGVAWENERRAEDLEDLRDSGIGALDLTWLGPLGPFNPDGSVGTNDGHTDPRER
jgi:hypothetical protein